MKQRQLMLLAIILAVLSILAAGFVSFNFIKHRNDFQIEVQKQIAELSAKLSETPVPKDGYTPIKNVDYFDGDDGSNGRNGRDAEDGDDGTSGTKGGNGLSAYELWLRAGNTGTLLEFLESLKVKGDPGNAGRTLEQRCNAIKLRVEQKYTDTETWEILYYLPEGAKCP